VLFLVPLFLLTALIYSSAGMGGGTTYIALLSIAGLPPNVTSSTGLVLNVVVVAVGLLNFRRGGHLKLRGFWPLFVSSVPAAYLGGRVALPSHLYFPMLAILLVLLGILTVFRRQRADQEPVPITRTAFLGMFAIGAVLGLIAGVFGFGGGIVLAPILVQLDLADSKRAAALSTVFILVNSASGIMGRVIAGNFVTRNLLLLGIVVAAGGYFGSKLGATRLSRLAVQRIQGAVLTLAGLRLFLRTAFGF